MRQSKHISGIAIYLISLTMTQAGNVAVYSLDEESPSNSHVILDSNGDPLAVGLGYISVGTFNTLSDEAISMAGDLNDWPAIIDDFDPFGEAGHINGIAGIVTHDASESVRENSSLLGKTIYVVIGNNPNGLGQSELLLVYKDDEVFPLDNPISEARVDITSASSENLLVGDPATQTITLTGTALEQFGTLSTIQMSGELGFQIKPFAIVELDLQFEEDTIDIAWNSLPGATYTVEFSEDLQEWTELVSGFDSLGAVTVFTDQNVPPNLTRRFYRISQE